MEWGTNRRFYSNILFQPTRERSREYSLKTFNVLFTFQTLHRSTFQQYRSTNPSRFRNAKNNSQLFETESRRADSDDGSIRICSEFRKINVCWRKHNDPPLLGTPHLAKGEFFQPLLWSVIITNANWDDRSNNGP